MDSNKRKLMEKVGFIIQEGCNLCMHGMFERSGDFGECSKLTYRHIKHNRTHGMTIHRSGTCQHYEPSLVGEISLGDYVMFSEDKDDPKHQ